MNYRYSVLDISNPSAPHKKWLQQLKKISKDEYCSTPKTAIPKIVSDNEKYFLIEN